MTTVAPPITPIRSAPLATGVLRLRSDEQLVELFAEGREDAFEAIHDRYRARLLAYVRQMLRGGSESEDVLQDVFVRAYTACARAGATSRSSPGSTGSPTTAASTSCAGPSRRRASATSSSPRPSTRSPRRAAGRSCASSCRHRAPARPAALRAGHPRARGTLLRRARRGARRHRARGEVAAGARPHGPRRGGRRPRADCADIRAEIDAHAGRGGRPSTRVRLHAEGCLACHAYRIRPRRRRSIAARCSLPSSPPSPACSAAGPRAPVPRARRGGAAASVRIGRRHRRDRAGPREDRRRRRRLPGRRRRVAEVRHVAAGCRPLRPPPSRRRRMPRAEHRLRPAPPSPPATAARRRPRSPPTAPGPPRPPRRPRPPRSRRPRPHRRRPRIPPPRRSRPDRSGRDGAPRREPHRRPRRAAGETPTGGTRADGGSTGEAAAPAGATSDASPRSDADAGAASTTPGR